MADLEMTPDMEHADVAGWIVGALDPSEHRRFRAHLESCTECQQTVAEFAPVAQKLATSLPAGELLADANPPADLQERTLARVRQAAGQQGTLADVLMPPSRGPRKRVTRYRPGAFLVSMAAAAVIAVGAAVSLILGQSAPALAFTIPMHARNGSTASGQATAHHTTDGWSIQLTARHLRRLGPNQFYECWYASKNSTASHPKLITAGSFTAGASGSVNVQMWSAADPRDFPTMQITVESAGDASQHGMVILSGTARS
jgi:Anti-sigma-K factor rskA/Putative zinc-finger